MLIEMFLFLFLPKVLFVDLLVYTLHFPVFVFNLGVFFVIVFLAKILLYFLWLMHWDPKDCEYVECLWSFVFYLHIRQSNSYLKIFKNIGYNFLYFCLQKNIMSNFVFFLCSIIQKAGNALEVLKEVLDAVDSQNPEVPLGTLFFFFFFLEFIFRHFAHDWWCYN